MNKKIYAVMSSAAVATILTAAVSTTAFAKVDGIVTKQGDKYSFYNYKELVDSATRAAVLEHDPLFDDYINNQVVAFHDDEKGNVDKSEVEKAAIISATLEKDFDIDEFTKSVKEAQLLKLPNEPVQRIVKDGKVIDKINVVEEEKDLAVKSVEAMNLIQVKVEFNKEVNKATAENIANYTFNGGISLSPDYSKAELQKDGKTVIITLDEVNGSEEKDGKKAETLENLKDYRLTIEGIVDAKGKMIAKTNKEFKTKDTILPTIVGVSTLPGSNAEIHVKFSEPIDKSHAGEYNVFGKDKVPVKVVNSTVSSKDLNTVILTTSNGFPVGDLEVSYIGKAKDYAGLQALPVYVGKVTSENQLDVTQVKEVKAIDENTVIFKFNNPITIPADNTFYWNRTGVSTDNIDKRKSTKVERLDSYTIKATFEGKNRLPKGEEVYVFAGDMKDTTGNTILDAKHQSFKVKASSSKEAQLIGVRAEENNILIATFDKVMNEDDIINKELYTLIDKDGKPVVDKNIDSKGHPIVDIKKDSKVQVRISGLKLKGGNYTLKVADMKDGNGYKVSGEKTFNIDDLEAPKFNGIEAVGINDGDKDNAKLGVYIRFNEKMDVNTLKDTNNFLVDTGNGLIKLDKNSNFIDITPVEDNKGVIIRFNNPQANALNKINYKVQFVKDIAGNVMNTEEGEQKVTTSNNSSINMNKVNEITRIDENTFTFKVNRHLLFIDKNDFLIGKGDEEKNYKIPVSVTFNNESDGTAKVTVVSKDSFGLNEDVTIKTTKEQKASLDIFGVQFSKATSELKIESNNEVKEAPKVLKAYVSAKNEITLEFNKGVNIGENDFEVVNPIDENKKLNVEAKAIENKVILTVENENFDFMDKLPVVKVVSMPFTQDAKGNKIEGNQTIEVKNIFATNVQLVEGKNTEDSNGAKAIVLTFNDAISPDSIIKNWTGNVDKNIKLNVKGETISFENVKNLGTITCSANEESLNGKSAVLSMSEDKKVIKITINKEDGKFISVGDAEKGKPSIYNPAHELLNIDGISINQDIKPKTVTNFGAKEVAAVKQQAGDAEHQEGKPGAQ